MIKGALDEDIEEQDDGNEVDEPANDQDIADIALPAKKLKTFGNLNKIRSSRCQNKIMGGEGSFVQL